ncbi:ATP-binding cassette domain-containing protein [Pseudonocardia sp. GCM10023141]|uniref:ATP-binding cassette domain-containing protein n=1 Tax=Pseudonocardia sp. GCM10023141 TaxID=3252653 RepID=UPI00360EF19A
MKGNETIDIVSANHVSKVYADRHVVVNALDDVTVSVLPGEALGIVGESGSGKTTLSRLLLGIERPTSGTVRYRGTDLTDLNRAGVLGYRRAVTAVFQNPYSSLDPRMRVWQIVMEQSFIEGRHSKPEREGRAAELLELVGLPASLTRRFPHQLSGGQRQRVAIARALQSDPELIVLDEATSALDVSVRAQIVNLLLDLQDRLGLTYLFIAHDLSLVRHLCQRTIVMYQGRVVEQGDTASVLADPSHPYTAALLEASYLSPEAIAGPSSNVPDEAREVLPLPVSVSSDRLM